MRMIDWLVGAESIEKQTDLFPYFFFVAETSIYRVLVFLTQVIEHILSDQTRVLNY